MRRGAGVPPAVAGASRPRRASRAEPVPSAAKECPRDSGRDARTTNLAAEDGSSETSKSPEQSQQVIENKGPAGEGSTHEARRDSQIGDARHGSRAAESPRASNVLSKLRGELCQ